MSALSYEQIRGFLRHAEREKRLVISPLLDPEEQLKGNQAGVDVRLGRAFSFMRPWSQGRAEGLVGPEGTLSPAVVDTLVLDFGEPLILHPHQFVLARTLEVVRIPDNLLAYVIGRSSWGRRGLIVATAVVVHPGFSGPVTLELKNVGEVPIAVYPMDRIAQLTFHEVGAGGADTKTVSQFASTFVPTLGKIRDTKTESRIRALAAARDDRGHEAVISGSEPPKPQANSQKGTAPQ